MTKKSSACPICGRVAREVARVRSIFAKVFRTRDAIGIRHPQAPRVDCERRPSDPRDQGGPNGLGPTMHEPMYVNGPPMDQIEQGYWVLGVTQVAQVDQVAPWAQWPYQIERAKGSSVFQAVQERSICAQRVAQMRPVLIKSSACARWPICPRWAKCIAQVARWAQMDKRSQICRMAQCPHVAQLAQLAQVVCVAQVWAVIRTGDLRTANGRSDPSEPMPDVNKLGPPHFKGPQLPK